MTPGRLHVMAAAGVCILISTHALGSVEALCDTVTMLHSRVIAHGVPSEVMTTDNLLTTFGMVA
ncbi:MAG: metal ABC transporter ATP-binding protein, partial [Corynebacterium variabile]|nr:metal ABC transporter ATP-binding protein [Corynebacterium variabile]